MSTAEYVMLGFVIGTLLMGLVLMLVHDAEEKNRARERRREQYKTQALKKSLAEASAQAAKLNAVALSAATALLDEAIRSGVVNNTPTSGVSAKHKRNPANPPSHRPD